jgi:hypothetical protein
MAPGKTQSGEAAQKHAYKVLSGLFDKYQQTRNEGSLTIEIIPPGVDPLEGQLVLEDEVERSIGIPKKALVAAFLYARRIFSERARDSFEDEVSILFMLHLAIYANF